MKKKSLFLIILSVIFSFSSANCQILEEVEEEVSAAIAKDSIVYILKELEKPDSVTEASIILSNNTNILFVKKSDVIVKTYRIRLLFDNSQSARTNSANAKELFESKFPEHAVYTHYTAPYFNVSAGDFLTYQEALAFSREIIKDFPKAFIVPHKMPITFFGTREQKIKEILDENQDAGYKQDSLVNSNNN